MQVFSIIDCLLEPYLLPALAKVKKILVWLSQPRLQKTHVSHVRASIVCGCKAVMMMRHVISN